MMSANRLFVRLSTAAFLLAMVGVFGVHSRAQQDPERRMGLVDDWSTHHVIFSDPGTERGAIEKGKYDHWWRLTNDPRYIMQQRRRHHEPGPPRDKYWQREAPGPHRDWAVSLGAGTVAQGMSPAKFSFDINAAPDCTNDFVVYGLNVAGSAATDATASGVFSGGSNSGATITITVNGTGYTFTASGTTTDGSHYHTGTASAQATSLMTAIGDNATLNGLVTAVANSPTSGEVALTAKSVGGTITITASTGYPNANFGSITSTSGTAQANLVALHNLYSGAASGIFTSTGPVTGSVITITANGTGYQFTAGTTYTRSNTPSTDATNIAAAINSTTTLDTLVTATPNSPTAGEVSLSSTTPGVAVSFANTSGVTNFGSFTYGTCSASSNFYLTPTFDWSYNATTNGGTVTTSPTLSDDATGSSVIYVESVSGGSYLHVLKWVAGEGTDATSGSVARTDILTAGLGVGSCTAGSSCLASIELTTTTGTSITSSTVTRSSPHYDYFDDIVYVWR